MVVAPVATAVDTSKPPAETETPDVVGKTAHGFEELARVDSGLLRQPRVALRDENDRRLSGPAVSMRHVVPLP